MTCDAKFTGSQQTLTRCKLSRLSPIQEHARCKPLKAARNLFIILNLSAHMKFLPNICKSPKYCQATPLFTPFVAPSTISDDDDHHHVFNCNLCSTFPVDFSNSIETKLEAPSMTHVNLVNKWEIKLKKGNGKCIPQHAYACSHMARTHVYWL